MEQKQYQQLLENAPFGYAYHEIILDQKGKPVDYRFLEVNKAFESLTGLKTSEITGRTVKEILPKIVEDEFDWIAFYGKVAMEGGSKTFEQFSPLLHKWFQVQAHCPAKGFFTTVFMDITEQKNKAVELENFFSVNLDLLCIADVEGNFIKVNKEWEAVLGYSVEELEHKKFLDFVHPDDIDATLAAMSSLGEQKKVLNFLNRYLAKDGSYHYIEWRSHPYGKKIFAAARDVTGWKLTEDALRNSEELKTSLIKSMDDLVFVLDNDLVFQDYSQPFSSELLIDPAFFIGKRFDAIGFPEPAAGICLKALRQCLETGSPVRSEYFLDLSVGRSWFDLHITPLKRAGGEQSGLTCVVRDISERKEAEEELRQAKNMLELVINNIPQLIFWKDRSGKYLGCNENGAKVAGLKKPDDILGKTDYELAWQEETADFFRECDERIMGSGKAEFGLEISQRQADGTEIWFSANKVPLYDKEGNVSGILVTYEDITERKSAESVLAAERYRLESIIEGTHVGTWEWNVETGQTIFNERWAEVIGYTLEEISPVSIDTWMKFAHPEDLKLSGELLQKHFSGELDYYECESRMRHKNGEWVWVLDRGKVATWSKDGKPLLMMGTHQDITEQKKAAEALKAAKEQAEKASNAKSEFLANMSHEIRTPLNAVIGFTELLGGTPLNKTQKQYLENANSSAQSLLGIISDILDFSKIEAGKLELELLKTDVAELAGQAMDIIKYQAAQKGLELLLNISVNLPRFAWVDPLRLRQILVNLLGNALKFTESGEIELKIDFEPGEGKGKFCFFVRDTGIGIKEEQKKRLFQAFSQADTSTTRKFGGTGLGLIISELLAQKMGSSIKLESVYKKGTTFHFCLETAYEHGEKVQREALQEVSRVLVVDDNEHNRIILEHTLANWGIECESADNGLSALKMIENSPDYDLIIMDYQMPYLDGLKTIRLIREKLALPASRQPVILLYSSSDDAGIHEECKKLGVYLKLVKPVKSWELQHQIKLIEQKAIPGASEDEEGGRDQSSPLQVGAKPMILVAEDVPMNMLLVKTMILRHLPDAQIIEARNGKEVLRSLELAPVDMIFMDMQMPHMDGLQATEAIREQEKTTGAHLPIVALTAGVLPEERDKCLASGMDEYLTKPIDSRALRGVLEKYILKEQGGQRPGPDQERNRTVSFDLAALKSSLEGDLGILKELVENSLTSFAEYVSRYKEALAQKNAQEMKAAAHTAKGSAWLMKFYKFADLAEQVEIYSEGEWEKLPAILEQVEAEWETVKEILRDLAEGWKENK